MKYIIKHAFFTWGTRQHWCARSAFWTKSGRTLGGYSRRAGRITRRMFVVCWEGIGRISELGWEVTGRQVERILEGQRIGIGEMLGRRSMKLDGHQFRKPCIHRPLVCPHTLITHCKVFLIYSQSRLNILPLSFQTSPNILPASSQTSQLCSQHPPKRPKISSQHPPSPQQNTQKYVPKKLSNCITCVRRAASPCTSLLGGC